jgi:hypothetical protein
VPVSTRLFECLPTGPVGRELPFELKEEEWIEFVVSRVLLRSEPALAGVSWAKDWNTFGTRIRERWGSSGNEHRSERA